MISISDFLKTGVRPLVLGRERLHVLFATYNNVDKYQSGLVPGTREGLTIQVQNGNLEVSSAILALSGSPDPFFHLIATEAIRAEGRGAQAELESSLQVQKDEGVSFLAFIYVGLTAFQSAVKMAQKLKQENPMAQIVVTTCDCDCYRKEAFLSRMIESGEIHSAVVTSECGGRDMMRDILEAVLKVEVDTKVSA